MDAPLTAAGLGAFTPFGDKAMTALRRLLGSSGVGVSGFPFAGPDQGAQRVLGAVGRSALDVAASPAFRAGLRRVDQPRRLPLGEAAPHHVPRENPLGPAFSLPPGGGLDLGPGLPGVATDEASLPSTPPRTTRARRR